MADAVTPNATVYVRNLDEKVKIPALTSALKEVFSECGTVVDVIAKSSVKRKGQAFVVFEDVSEAQDAVEILQGFDLLGRPMELAFAKTKSDWTVLKEGGEAALEQHKKHRLAEKERKQAAEAAAAAAKPAKRAADPSSLAERPAKATKATGAAAMADEYLPPNKILILRELPEDYTKEALTAVFQRYPGFKEVRMVPGRKGLAFAEYTEESEAITAKEAMNGANLGDKTIRVTFQRQ
ncbi:uncharacterized protein RHO25_007709 [Cercospora beticola]|uniref:RRM domain-containing protein n=2 Tax=Cercospora beticola TaxID=122368 RepID=A0ABZ0NU03_CERBT|nr:hypothetical protein RHO25_007709 [Cercospora beticola]CAK1358223.1 unnamed protein product [Cercospora beticola]